MHRIIAIVGMAGSGKSEAAKVFTEGGLPVIRFGDLTDEELRRRGMPVNEANERQVREQLRKEHGMAAYAILNIPKIESNVSSGPVVLDGLYSFEEYLVLREHFRDALTILAIYASPKTRAERLAHRAVRPLTAKELRDRDYSEIKNLNKAAPIALADFTIVNEGSLSDLRMEVEEFQATQR